MVTQLLTHNQINGNAVIYNNQMNGNTVIDKQSD